jgi:hypothetical protein
MAYKISKLIIIINTTCNGSSQLSILPAATRERKNSEKAA